LLADDPIQVTTKDIVAKADDTRACEPQRNRTHILLLVGAILFLSGNWILPLVDRDEPRFAEASREMLQRGDYVIPWFNGVHRYDKPPLIYWCQIASYRLLGTNAFTARLPSALFALATVLILYHFGRRVADETTAFRAGLMFTTCLAMLIYGRLAIADMPLICFVTLGIWAGWEMIRTSASPSVSCRWWWLFHLSLALGFLAKGPVAWLPVIPLLVCLRSNDTLLKALRPQFGIPIVLIVIGAWGIPALLQSGGEFLKVGIGKHVIGRSFSVMEGHGAKDLLGYLLSLPFFFVTFFPAFFPWSIYAVEPIRKAWNNRNHDRFGFYLGLNVGLFFLVFTLSRTKLPHYTLPAFPCIALLVARSFAHRTGADQLIRRWSIGFAVFAAGLTLVVMPQSKPKFASAALFEQCRPHLQPDMVLGSVDYQEPSIVWEFRQIIDAHLTAVDPAGVSEFLRTNRTCILIGTTNVLGPAAITLAEEYRWLEVSGYNVAKGRPVTLRAIIK
jgi:4-amino-4-deoxy-L-arabinose transferase-like glycosyltransferase